MTGAAEAANRPELAAFAVLVLSVQKFFGIPISTFCIRKDLGIKRQQGYFKKQVETTKALRLPSMRIFKETPKNLRTNTIYICKVALVACLADLSGKQHCIPGSSPENYILNPNISYLLFGLIFCKNRVSRKGYFCKIRIFWHYYVWSAFDASGQPCPGITIQPVEYDRTGIWNSFALLYWNYCTLWTDRKDVGVFPVCFSGNRRYLHACLSCNTDYYNRGSRFF